MSLFRRLSILLSLLFFTLAFALALASLLTDFWMETPNGLTRNGQPSKGSFVQSGLFHGTRKIEWALGPRFKAFSGNLYYIAIIVLRILFSVCRNTDPVQLYAQGTMASAAFLCRSRSLVDIHRNAHFAFEHCDWRDEKCHWAAGNLFVERTFEYTFVFFLLTNYFIY